MSGFFFSSALIKLVVVGALAASYPAATFADEQAPRPSPTEPEVQVEPAATLPPPPAPPSPSLLVVPAATVVPPPSPAPNAVPRPQDLETPASPAPDERFGDAGQIVFNGALSASLGHLGYSTGGSSNSSFSLQPAFDYFASRNCSVGGAVLIRYTSSTSDIDTGSKSLTLGITGQVGYNVRLGDHVSFWPKVSLGVWQDNITYSAPGYGFSVTLDGTSMPVGTSSSVTESAVFVELFAPFLVHPAPHFFVGFGPDGYADLLHTAGSASNRRLFLGASSTIGGWF